MPSAPSRARSRRPDQAPRTAREDGDASTRWADARTEEERRRDDRTAAHHPAYPSRRPGRRGTSIWTRSSATADAESAAAGLPWPAGWPASWSWPEASRPRRAHPPDHVPAGGRQRKPLTYAVGSVIHPASAQVDVGEKVESLVAADGRTRVYSTTDRTARPGAWRHRTSVTRRCGHLERLVGPASASSSATTDVNVVMVGRSRRIAPLARLLRRHGRRPSTSELAQRRALWTTTRLPRRASRLGRVACGSGTVTALVDRRGAARCPSSAVMAGQQAFTGAATCVDAAGDKVLVHVADGMAVDAGPTSARSTSGSSAAGEPGGDLSEGDGVG